MSRNRRGQNVVVDFVNNSGGSLRATPGRARQVRALLFSRHPERRHGKRSIRRYVLLSDIPIGFRLAHPPKSLSLITNSDSNQQHTRPASAEDNTTHSSTSFLGSSRRLPRQSWKPRPRTARESPRHFLADKYLNPARQTARSPSAAPELPLFVATWL